MGRLNRFLVPWIMFSMILTGGVCFGDELDLVLMTLDPDVLILLDLSGSMNQNPAGEDSCSPLSRLQLNWQMAKDAIKMILDDNHDLVIDGSDETSLAVRIGYMRFSGGDDTGNDYNSGKNKLMNPIPSTDPPPFSSPSRYSDVWASVTDESASGGTPLASALNEAKLYLNSHKDADGAKACRQKYVILVTDGQDTYACNGNGIETQPDMYKRRKATVAKARALRDAGYKVYVIGFGAAMPAELKNTLNWTAYHGGTINQSDTQSGRHRRDYPVCRPMQRRNLE